MEINLRPAVEADREFLYAVHCRTMRGVIEKTWGWNEAWQRSDFDRRFTEYLVSIIVCDRADVGGLLLEWRPEALYIHEVQLLPEYQGKGIGTIVVQQALQQGVNRRLPVTLSVLLANPRAKRLYERLGFEVISVESPFIRMRQKALLARAVLISGFDPFSGTWVFAAAESHWLGPAPKLWVQEIACADGRVRIRERITSASGEQTNLTINAAFDGQEYPVSGSPHVETIAYTWPEPFRIDGTARKAGRVVFREVVAVTPEQDRLTVAITISSADGRTLDGTAVFLRDGWQHSLLLL